MLTFLNVWGFTLHSGSSRHGPVEPRVRVDKATISRLKFNRMSDKVKDFVNRGLLAEFHLREICSLSTVDTLSPWLTTQPVVKRGSYHVVFETKT